MNTTISKKFHFSAGHMLPNHFGKCAHPHGHNYGLVVSVTGPIQEETYKSDEGMVIDFGELSKVVNRVIEPLDHHFMVKGDEWVYLACWAYKKTDFLDEDFTVLKIRTTAENLALWIADRVLDGLLKISKPDSVTVELWETESSSSTVTVYA
jgi:6-pyruvoyltetrahydropterin/6-carboxytetrahydropterin synthase